MDVQGECPLSWPLGWVRTEARGRGSWPNAGRIGQGAARERLIREVAAIGAEDVVLSTNQALRLDGLPRASSGEPDDPGVAVYFLLRGRQTVLACDRFNTLAGNYRALALHLEAMRGMERWGVGTLDQAFSAYAMLPAKGETSGAWRDVLGVGESATAAEIRQAYAAKVKSAHPDGGGTPARLAEVMAAMAEARRLGLVA